MHKIYAGVWDEWIWNNEYDIMKYNDGAESHQEPLLLTWFNLNLSMDK